MSGSEVAQAGSISHFLRAATGGLTHRIGLLVGRLGIRPNTLTALSLLPALIAAALIADGQFAAAGLVLVVSAPLDILDGAVARAMSQATAFGALLDSTVDRIVDGALHLALVWYFLQADQPLGALAAGGALIGAFLVSYIRARGEGLALGSIKGGLFDRVFRVSLLIGALLTGWVLAGTLVLCAGSLLTALFRLWAASKLSAQADSETSRSA